MTARRSWTYKTHKALCAETPSELMALAKSHGYAAAQWSQLEYAHSLHAFVMFNVKGSKMLADPNA
jgi:hypothetical protein